MLKYSKCSPCDFVIAVIYFERLKRAISSRLQADSHEDATTLRLTRKNTQRLLLTAVAPKVPAL